MEDIYRTIYELLIKERDSGTTQNEMSRRSGVAQSRICRLLDSRMGISNIKRLGLETFLKLFPNAHIDLGIHDTHSMGNVSNNNGQVVNGDVHGDVNSTEEGILSQIMKSDDIDAETKVKIYKIIKR